MKKVIIGIHGLGNKPSKRLLSKWWKDSMLEGFTLYGIEKELPEFELVYWADIVYEKPLNKRVKDEEDPLFLDGPYVKDPKITLAEKHPYQQKVIDFIDEQLHRIFLNKDKSLNFTHVTDLVLRKFFYDLELYYMEGSEVRDLIRGRLVKAVNKYPDHEIMIIAHSMGSIIAYDVLSFMIPEFKINTLITVGSPLGLPIILGKTIQEQKKRQSRKRTLYTPPGITGNWYNYADITDYVALNYKLADDFRKNKNGVFPIDYLVSNNYAFQGDKNPHKLYGYLRTPEFTSVLSDFIGEEKSIVQ
jgi:hypothetical protein